MPPKKRSRAEHAPGGQQNAGAAQEAVHAGIEAARKKAEEEGARVLSEATEAAAKVMEEANATKAEAEKKSREVQEDRAALEEEKAAMEKAHTFQASIIRLNVGGHSFTTSRMTLTSVPNTYFASLFSGRFELTPDDGGAYFIDRDPTHFRHILHFLRDPTKFKLSSDLVAEGQRGGELEAEAEVYGLLNHVTPRGPYVAQGRIGRSLVQAACRTGNARADGNESGARARV
jgi:hypothetical protein